MGNGTQLGRVRGLGAGGGAVVHHWWLQRVTAVASLFLVLWFVFSLARLPSLDYASTVMWMRQPLVAVPMCLLFEVGLIAARFVPPRAPSDADGYTPPTDA